MGDKLKLWDHLSISLYTFFVLLPMHFGCYGNKVFIDLQEEKWKLALIAKLLQILWQNVTEMYLE